MENILLVVNLVLATILVLLILVQKSEGGALGIGVSQDNFMLSRSAGNFMGKATAVVATLFIICSLALTIISRGELTPTSSVLDIIEEKSGATKHFYVSILKSTVRIGGYVLLPFDIIAATIVLIISELIGVIEEMV